VNYSYDEVVFIVFGRRRHHKENCFMRINRNPYRKLIPHTTLAIYKCKTRTLTYSIVTYSISIAVGTIVICVRTGLT